MTSTAKKLLWISFVYVLGFGLVLELFPLSDAGSRVKTLRKSGIGYASREMPLTSVEDRLYQDATVVKRVYQFGMHRFALTAVDATNNRHAIHDPMYCFGGSGWDIVIRKEISIEGGTAMYLRLHKNYNEREVIFWFSDGRNRYPHAIRYWFQATLRRLTLGLSGNEPVLMIIQSFENEYPKWEQILTQFGLLYEL